MTSGSQPIYRDFLTSLYLLPIYTSVGGLRVVNENIVDLDGHPPRTAILSPGIAIGRSMSASISFAPLSWMR